MNHSIRRNNEFKPILTDSEVVEILSNTRLIGDYSENWKLFDGILILSLFFGEGYNDLNLERLRKARIGALMDIRYSNTDINGASAVRWSKLYRKSVLDQWVLEE